MKNILVSIITIFLLSSCGPYWYKPYGRIFTHVPKDGTPGYRQGWMDGCESGLATQFGSAIMMAFYQWKKDPDLAISNPDLNLIRSKYGTKWDINWDNINEVKANISQYKAVFWMAHGFCRHSIVGTYQTARSAYGATMDPPLPGETRYDPGAHSLGNVWSFHGRGSMHPTMW